VVEGFGADIFEVGRDVVPEGGWERRKGYGRLEGEMELSVLVIRKMTREG
jgi:hypothetical protein